MFSKKLACQLPADAVVDIPLPVGRVALFLSFLT